MAATTVSSRSGAPSLETPLSIPEGPGVVYGVYAPNAPTLIAPGAFHGTLAGLAAPSARTVEQLRGLDLPNRVRPDAIVVVSPHFFARGTVLVQASDRPPPVHDFSGMPDEVNRVEYAPPGDPALAAELVADARARGLPVQSTTSWGLDHGAWAALMHLAPAADLPVVPVSISDAAPQQFIDLGRSIRETARRTGRRIAVVGTGSLVHNFDLFLEPLGTGRWPASIEIEDHLLDLVVRRDLEALLGFDRTQWRYVDPEGNAAPLFAVLGALGPDYTARVVATAGPVGMGGLAVVEFVP